MKKISLFEKIYVCNYPVDFRKGLLSLSAMIQSELDENPFSGALFIFYNKKKNCIKSVYWDETGFAMWIKMLDKEKFPFPKKRSDKKLIIHHKQFEWLLSGINPWKIIPHKKLEYKKII